MKKFWLVACLFMGVVAFAQDEKTEAGGVLLRYKFTKGDVRTYESKQVQKSEVMGRNMTSEYKTTYTKTVNDVKDRVASITYKVENMKIDMDMGGTTTSFDSTKEEDTKSAKGNPMLAPITKTIGESVTYKMSNKGEVMDIDLKSAGGNKASKAMAEGIKSSQMAFPDKEVAKGYKWPISIEMDSGGMGKMKMAFTLEFTGVKDLDGEKCAVIKTEVDKFEMAGGGESPMEIQIENAKGTGTAYFSLDRGDLKKSNVKMSYDMKMSAGGDKDGKSMTMHFDMEQKEVLVK